MTFPSIVYTIPTSEVATACNKSRHRLSALFLGVLGFPRHDPQGGFRGNRCHFGTRVHRVTAIGTEHDVLIYVYR
jgi:hypothetical protein